MSAFVQAGFGYTAAGSGSNVVTTGVGDTGLASSVLLNDLLDVLYACEIGSTGYVPAITFTGTATLSPVVSSGAIATFNTPSGGVAAAGSYANKALSGGSGTGATFNATVTGTSITAFAIQCGGMGYLVGDSMTFAGSLVGGSGTWTVTVASISAGVIDYFVDATTNDRQYYRFLFNVTAGGTCQVVGTIGQTFQTPLIAAAELSGIGGYTAGQVGHSASPAAVASGSTYATPSIPCAAAGLLCGWGWSWTAGGTAPTAGGGASVQANGWKGMSTGGTTNVLTYETLVVSTATAATFTAADNFNNAVAIGAIFSGASAAKTPITNYSFQPMVAQ